MNKNKIYYIEVLRFLACIFVVMLHVSALYYESDIGSFNFWVADIFEVFSRFCVPIFVMISGALFLDESYCFSFLKLKSHILKLILFLIFWSVFYAFLTQVFLPILNHKTIIISNIFISIIDGHFHLWYIYMIIGLYLTIPLLRLWVNKENKRYIEYFIIISSIFCFLIPQIVNILNIYSNFEFLYNVIQNFNLQYFGVYITYFLLGWYLNNISIKKYKFLIYLGLLSIILSIFGTYFISVYKNNLVQIFYNYSAFNVLLESLMIFIIVKNKTVNSSKKNRIISIISNYSLGIYAIHPAIIYFLYNVLGIFNFDLALFTIPIIWLTTIFLSVFFVFIMDKIPILKKII